MNERIREFAHRCGFTEYRGDDGADDESLTKFAELIIAECVTVCEEQKEMYAMLNETAGEDATWAAMTTAVTSCTSGIKKHFGVEK